jgi:transposase-like protein
MNFLQLSALIPDKITSLLFLQQRGVLHNPRVCSNGHPMTLQLTNSHDRWRCKRRQCREDLQLRSDTWLLGSKLSYRKVVLFIYCWTYEMTSVEFCDRELLIGKNATIDWNNYLREVCAGALLHRPNQMFVGGVGLHVEIDESLFSKRKNNVGRVINQQWVFGGICRETRECFLVAVPDRTANTLMNVIQTRIRPGTIILSDMWAAYAGIQQLGPQFQFQHLIVNHTVNFVNPANGAHTQNIENMWYRAKKRNKRQHGTHRQMLDGYLCEFMWRQSLNGRNPFDAIIADIVTYFAPG